MIFFQTGPTELQLRFLKIDNDIDKDKALTIYNRHLFGLLEHSDLILIESLGGI